jgi:hypothetical protein
VKGNGLADAAAGAGNDSCFIGKHLVSPWCLLGVVGFFPLAWGLAARPGPSWLFREVDGRSLRKLV